MNSEKLMMTLTGLLSMIQTLSVLISLQEVLVLSTTGLGSGTLSYLGILSMTVVMRRFIFVVVLNIMHLTWLLGSGM